MTELDKRVGRGERRGGVLKRGGHKRQVTGCQPPFVRSDGSTERPRTACKFNIVPGRPPRPSLALSSLTPPLTGAQNMAVDVALMARARQTGEAVFRIYTWGVPTLSFGRNQTAVGRYDLDRIRAASASRWCADLPVAGLSCIGARSRIA